MTNKTIDHICDNCGKSWEDLRRRCLLPQRLVGQYFKHPKREKPLTLCLDCWLSFRYGDPNFVPPDAHTAELWRQYHKK